VYGLDSNVVCRGEQLISTAAKNQWEGFNLATVIEQDGYIKAYLMNEDEEDVWIYDFTVTHTTSPIVQEQDYYPGGLTFNSVTRTATNTQYYKYNGKELQPEIGWYDYGARMYIPDILRWGTVDPLAGAQEDYSPYHYVYGNPILYNDPTGMIGEDSNEDITTWVHDTENDRWLWIDDGYFFTFEVSASEFDAIQEAGRIKDAGGEVYNRWFWRAVLEDLRGNAGKN